MSGWDEAMLSITNSSFLGLVTIVAAFAIDQLTKATVVANASLLSTGVAVFPGFNLTFHRNDGITFGLLSGTPWWVLVLLASAICLWLAAMLIRTDSRIEIVAYGAIIGGALGNVVDRLRFQAVTDFLDFYVGSVHWPTFNFADVFVVGGAVLLVIASVFQRPQKSDI